jgi:hypothetical protein
MALFFAGCTATTQAPEPAAAGQSQFENLQVLPRNIERDQLIATMRSFNRALGVRCNHCHVVTATEPKEEFDFPNDTKEEKRVARVMLRMVSDINGKWMPLAEAAEHGETAPHETGDPQVRCWTCHRGSLEPESAPPPAENAPGAGTRSR